MIYLEIEDLIHVAERVLGTVEVRDFGLIASAVARPQSRAFGEDAYPTIHHKAAALIHSIARSHALVDGNKRLSLAAAVAFYGMNGFRFTLTNNEAYDLIVSVATGTLDEVEEIADLLRQRVEPR